MKPSARVASVFIFLFFIFFNALQVYLIRERIAETKSKFHFACNDAMFLSLQEYNKRKITDSASMPRHAWIAYSQDKIEVNRLDSQNVKFSSPLASLVTDTIELAMIEPILHGPSFRSVNFELFGRLYKQVLDSKQVRTTFRLDTIMHDSKIKRPPMPVIWNQKRTKEYEYATRPLRIPQYSSFSIFAEFKTDPAFFRKDLLWPMVAFGFILLIGNTALLFVYSTIRKQKRINELKTDFINNLTHEMKTPITIARAGIEALEHHIPAGERNSFYLQTSKKQLHLLNEFVERILDAAVRDLSDFNLKKEKTDLHALLNELVQSHSILPGKPTNIVINGEGPVYIQADRLHLETAFHNIIDNASRYSHDSVNIIIDIAENNRECIVKIRDNGMGIPPQFIKNIFEKFFRVPQGDAQAAKGFGLGLYYVNSIVKKHGGNITVQSKLKSGTEFIITLPKNT